MRLGQEALAPSPNSGVNSLTGEGLAEAMKGASVVVDVSDALPEDAAVMNFFGCSELRYFRVELWLDEALQRAGPKKLLFGSALRLIGALGRD